MIILIERSEFCQKLVVTQSEEIATDTPHSLSFGGFKSLNSLKNFYYDRPTTDHLLALPEIMIEFI